MAKWIEEEYRHWQSANQIKLVQTGRIQNHLFFYKIDSDLSQSVLEGILYGQISLSGDAHHEEGLEGHEDVLEGVPHVGEEHDEHLVVQVQVESLWEG